MITKHNISNNVSGNFRFIFRSPEINFFVFLVPSNDELCYVNRQFWVNESILKKTQTRFGPAVVFQPLCKVSKELDKLYESWSLPKITIHSLFYFWRAFTMKIFWYFSSLTLWWNWIASQINKSQMCEILNLKMFYVL